MVDPFAVVNAIWDVYTCVQTKFEINEWNRETMESIRRHLNAFTQHAGWLRQLPAELKLASEEHHKAANLIVGMYLEILLMLDQSSAGLTIVQSFVGCLWAQLHAGVSLIMIAS